jgi:TonB family protein
MALTGQLSDMSLAELIEFFCNQRKTGRLKIDYPRGHSVFFIKDGELVDAKVGALSGAEAVYFSLTLPNAAFDFSPDVEATRRTINQRWTQVVLEGLRRLDEGLSPTEADAFGSWSPTESDLVVMLDQVEHLGDAKSRKAAGPKSAAESSAREASAQESSRRASSSESSSGEHSARESSDAAPLSLMVEGAGQGGSKKKWVFAGVAASVLLACAVAGVPLLTRSSKSESAQAPAVASQPAAPQSDASAAPATNESTDATPESAPAESADASAAADAARRERDARERERRKREQDAQKANEQPADAAATKPAPATPSGPKSVRVTVTYDEAGRVTQASVAGATPGAEAYGSTAVRIARGKHFPAGKPGSTVVTIPVN